MSEMDSAQADEISRKINQLLQESEALNSPQERELTMPHVEGQWWSVAEAMTISSVVLLFGVVVFFTIAYLISKGNNPDQLLRIFGTSLIIIMAIFLVVAGYGDQQIAPVMGLLGTIAGYLLGKGAGNDEKTKKQEE